MEKGHTKDKSIAFVIESSEKYDDVKTKTVKATLNKNVCEGRIEANKGKEKLKMQITPQLKMS